MLTSHLQRLLDAHDAVAQKDYNPRLSELPQDVDKDEETIKIAQLVKSDEPLVRYLKRTALQRNACSLFFNAYLLSYTKSASKV